MAQSAVYIAEHYSEPMTPQHNFSQNYDLGNPTRAMSVYSRIMHEHTKKQLNTATDSARRRSDSLSPASSNASVNSTGS